jgi:hypothetical protein
LSAELLKLRRRGSPRGEPALAGLLRKLEAMERMVLYRELDFGVYILFVTSICGAASAPADARDARALLRKLRKAPDLVAFLEELGRLAGDA